MAGLCTKMDYGSQVKDLLIYSLNIYNSYVPQSGTVYYGGIAGYIEGTSGIVEASVKNVNIQNATIWTGGIVKNSGTIYAGSIGGFTYRAVIKNCTVKGGKIQNNSNAQKPNRIYAGGIAGEANNTTISVCMADYLVDVDAIGAVYAGGIVGSASWKNATTPESLIEKCYTKRSVGAGSDECSLVCLGGIAGLVESGMVQNCYNTSAPRALAKAVTDSSAEGFSVSTHSPSGTGSAGGGSTSKTTTKTTKTITVTRYSCYVGGIVGKTANTISNCYFSGSYITYQKNFKATYKISSISNATRKITGGRYGSVGISHNYDGAEVVFIFQVNLSHYNICGGGGATISNCYYKSAINKEATVSYSIGGATILNNSSQAGNVKNAISYNASNLSSVSFTVSAWEVSGKTCLVCTTPISGTTLPEQGSLGVSGIVNGNESVWAIDSTKNGGLPYIKDFYWENFISEPSKA